MPLITTIGALSARALGFAKTMITDTYFFLYGGRYETANAFAVGGVIASEQGTVIVSATTSSNTRQGTRFNNDGEYISSLQNDFGSSLPRPYFVTNSPTNPAWYYPTPGRFVNYTLESAPNTWQLSSPVGGSSGSFSIEIDSIAVNSTGVIAFTTGFQSGKESFPLIMLYNSSNGAFINGRSVTNGGPATWQYAKIKARTDNNFVWFRMTGSVFHSWLVSPTSSTPTDPLRYGSGAGDFEGRQAVIDANNNIYGAGVSSINNSIDVMRVNSARAPTHLVRWQITSGIYQGTDAISAGSTSIAQYGNFVYLAAPATSGGGPTFAHWLLICLNAADLTFAWGKVFSAPGWSGGNAFAGNLGAGPNGKSMWATQNGLWMLWAAGPFGSFYQYLNKLPLNGQGINGTYSVAGINITIADYTPSLSGLQTPFLLTTPGVVSFARSADFGTNTTLASGTNPNAVRVLIG